MPKWLNMLKSVAGVAAPMVLRAAGGPGGGFVGDLIADKLGSNNTDDAIAAAIRADPTGAAIKLAELQKEKAERFEELAFETTKLEIEERKHALAEETKRILSENETTAKNIAEVNATMRAEYQTDGTFKSGWRPFFGWQFGLSFMAMTGTMIYGAVQAIQAGEWDIAQRLALTALGMMASGGAVLGVNIKMRSDDKKVMNGIKPVGIVKTIMGKTD